MRSFFFAQEPVNHSPSSSYLPLSTYWVMQNAIFSLSFPILDSVASPVGVLTGRGSLVLFVLGFVAIDELVNMLVKSSGGRKTGR